MTKAHRRITRPIAVGPVTIGGGGAIVVQGMTNTNTADVDKTVRQIRALISVGAELVRVAVPTRKDTAALRDIVSRVDVPIIADVHFHYKRALEAVEAGVHKLRINPGNLRDRPGLRKVIAAAKAAGIPIRIGVNAGSIRSKSQLGKTFSPQRLLKLMLNELTRYVRFFERAGFDQLVLSAKSADVMQTVQLYEALSEQFDYPLHVGLTHSGTVWAGSIRSTAVLTILLEQGIGDTIRVSLAGDPVREIYAAKEILTALGLIKRTGPELIVCPTCGRCQVDLAKIADQVERRLTRVTKPIKVAVMGCIVNGPGEAADADVALIAAKGSGLIYRRGRRVAKVPAARLVARLMQEINAWQSDG